MQRLWKQSFWMYYGQFSNVQTFQDLLKNEYEDVYYSLANYSTWCASKTVEFAFRPWTTA